MNEQARAEHERNLSTAILALWLFFEPQIKKGRMPDYRHFCTNFDAEVKPIITAVYGNARHDLATQFGVNYPQRPGDSGSVIAIPRLTASIDEYSRDLYNLFGLRAEKIAQGQTQSQPIQPPIFDVPSPFEPYDAVRIAVTTVTAAKAGGEFDAAADIQARTGRQLVAVWKCELGACKKCRFLEGKPWSVWRLICPGGPPLHPRCRCDLIWRWLIA